MNGDLTADITLASTNLGCIVSDRVENEHLSPLGTFVECRQELIDRWSVQIEHFR